MIGIREKVSIDDAVRLLNELYQLDPEAMERLIKHTQICTTPETGTALQAHPALKTKIHWPEDLPCVGILGIINSMFGIHDDGKHQGEGAITANFDEQKRLLGFSRTARKAVLPKRKPGRPKKEREGNEENH